MSRPSHPYTLLDVFEEVDQVVYTFADEDALTACALNGDETFVAARPATAQDAISDDELYAWIAADANTPRPHIHQS